MGTRFPINLSLNSETLWQDFGRYGWLRLQAGAWEGWIATVSFIPSVFLACRTTGPALSGRASPLKRELLHVADLYLIPKPFSSKVAHSTTLPIRCVKNIIRVQILPHDVSKIRGTHRLFRRWRGIQALPAARIHVSLTSTHGSDLGVLDSGKNLLFSQLKSYRLTEMYTKF